MPACGYDFYLLVINSISHEFAALAREFISTRGHVISSIYATGGFRNTTTISLIIIYYKGSIR